MVQCSQALKNHSTTSIGVVDDRFNVIELFGGILPLHLVCQRLKATPFRNARTPT